MITNIQRKHTTFIYRAFSAFIAITFIFSSIVPPAYAQTVIPSVLNLPSPGTLVPLSPTFNPPIIKGITIHPENPLLFDFIVHPGDDNIRDQELEDESTKLIKYFMASLTVPEDQMWVNLSPYEKDRIVPQALGETEMGRDLLAQDYLLKQLTASLMYPEDELGSEFWNRVYKRAYEEYGTTEIPMNTFNKIWIMPETASIYEHGTSVFVVDSHLKVMLEEDYLALEVNKNRDTHGIGDHQTTPIETGIESEIIREILIPEIEKEVNQGKTFANLRQIYNSVILATWYKQNLKESLLGQVYVDQNKTKGIDIEDKEIKNKIYNQYLKAFKVGVYNYIKEDYDPRTNEIIPRKYFSGGVGLENTKLTPGVPQDKDFLVGMDDSNRVLVEFDPIAASSPVDVIAESDGNIPATHAREDFDFMHLGDKNWNELEPGLVHLMAQSYGRGEWSFQLFLRLMHRRMTNLVLQDQQTKRVIGYIVSGTLEDEEYREIRAVKRDKNFGKKNTIFSHDLTVLEKYRGLGLRFRLRNEIIREARKREGIKYVTSLRDIEFATDLPKGVKIVETIADHKTGKTSVYLRIDLYQYEAEERIMSVMADVFDVELERITRDVPFHYLDYNFAAKGESRFEMFITEIEIEFGLVETSPEDKERLRTVEDILEYLAREELEDTEGNITAAQAAASSPVEVVTFQLDAFEEEEGYRFNSVKSPEDIERLVATYRENPRLVLDWRVTKEFSSAFYKAHDDDEGSLKLLERAMVIASQYMAMGVNNPFIHEDLRAFITHPLEVAYHFVRLGISDKRAVLAALFHHVLYTIEEKEWDETLEEIFQELNTSNEGVEDEVISREEFKTIETILVERMPPKKSLSADAIRTFKTKGRGGKILRAKGIYAEDFDHLEIIAAGFDQKSLEEARELLADMTEEDRIAHETGMRMKVIGFLQDLYVNESEYTAKPYQLQQITIDRMKEFLQIPDVFPQSLLDDFNAFLDLHEDRLTMNVALRDIKSLIHQQIADMEQMNALHASDSGFAKIYLSVLKNLIAAVSQTEEELLDIGFDGGKTDYVYLNETLIPRFEAILLGPVVAGSINGRSPVKLDVNTLRELGKIIGAPRGRRAQRLANKIEILLDIIKSDFPVAIPTGSEAPMTEGAASSPVGSKRTGSAWTGSEEYARRPLEAQLDEDDLILHVGFSDPTNPTAGASSPVRSSPYSSLLNGEKFSDYAIGEFFKGLELDKAEVIEVKEVVSEHEKGRLLTIEIPKGYKTEKNEMPYGLGILKADFAGVDKFRLLFNDQNEMIGIFPVGKSEHDYGYYNFSFSYIPDADLANLNPDLLETWKEHAQKYERNQELIYEQVKLFYRYTKSWPKVKNHISYAYVEISKEIRNPFVSPVKVGMFNPKQLLYGNFLERRKINKLFKADPKVEKIIIPVYPTVYHPGLKKIAAEDKGNHNIVYKKVRQLKFDPGDNIGDAGTGTGLLQVINWIGAGKRSDLSFYSYDINHVAVMNAKKVNQIAKIPGIVIQGDRILLENGKTIFQQSEGNQAKPMIFKFISANAPSDLLWDGSDPGLKGFSGDLRNYHDGGHEGGAFMSKFFKDLRYILDPKGLSILWTGEHFIYKGQKLRVLSGFGLNVTLIRKKQNDMANILVFQIQNPELKSSSPVGGIDLNPQAIEMDKRGVGVNFQLPAFDPALFQNSNIEGFIPIIINISPITNIPLLLGLSDTEEQPTNLGFESLDPLEKRDRFKVGEPEQLSLLN